MLAASLLPSLATPVGQCRSGPDEARACATYDTLRVISQKCSLKCLVQSQNPVEPNFCHHQCMMEKGGFSSGCSSCYVDFADCARDQCVTSCAAYEYGEHCRNCMRNHCFPDLETCTGFTCNQLPQCADTSSKASIPGCNDLAAERADRNYFWWINPRLKIGSYFQDDSDGNEVVPVGVNGPGDPFTGRAWEQYGGDGATPTLDLYSQIPNLGR